MVLVLLLCISIVVFLRKLTKTTSVLDLCFVFVSISLLFIIVTIDIIIDIVGSYCV